MGLDLKKLRVRALTALVFVIILLSCINYSYYTFIALFFLVALWVLYEFYELVVKMGYAPYATIGMVSGVLTFMSVYAWQLPDSSVDTLFLRYGIYLVPFLIATRFVFSKSEHAFQEFAFTIAGVFYCILPFALLVQVPTSAGENVNDIANNYVAFKILGIIFLLWVNDTGAYLGGSLFGKHKLFERVSPGKTWEGTIIGIVFCVALGFILNIDKTFSSPLTWPLIAVCVGVLGTIGDLIESLLKRKAGVKDSGALMPGHGGMFDRFDSLLFVSPFIFVLLKLTEGAH